MKAARYIVREDPHYPGEGWWQVYDTVQPSVPALANGRFIYSGRDKARAQADADWLNGLQGSLNDPGWLT